MMYFSSTLYPADGLTYSWEAVPYYLCGQSVTENNSAIIYENRVGLQVISRVNINVCGAWGPPYYYAQSFSFDPTGTNNLAGINNARLYYTTTPTFSDANLFATANMGGLLNFTSVAGQLLISGANYFWLVYDVNENTLNGDVLAASCTQYTLREMPGAIITSYTPDANQSTRVIRGPLSGDYIIGNVPDADYPNLTNAVNDLNSLGMMSNVNFLIASDITEPAPVQIGEWVTVPTGSNFTLNITPLGNYNISCAATSLGVLNLNGCDYLTIGDPTNTYRLGIINTQTTGGGYGIWIRNHLTIANNGATYNNIYNCDIKCGLNSNSGQFGIYMNQNYNTNNLIYGNTIQRAYAGIYFSIPSNSISNINTVANNLIGSTVNENRIYYYGIYNYYSSNVVFNNNEVFGMYQSGYNYAMYLYYSNYLTVTNNKIHDLVTTSVIYGAYMYYCQYYTFSNNEIYNNSNSSTFYGIYTYQALNSVFSHNKIHDNISTSTFYTHYLYYFNSSLAEYNEVYNNTGASYYNHLYYSTGATFQRNKYWNLTATGTMYNLYLYYGGTNTVQDNEWYNIRSNGGTLYGVYHYNSTGNTFQRNKIHGLRNYYTSGTTYGYYAYASSTSYSNLNMYNNQFYDIKGYGYTSASYYVYGVYLYSTFTGINMYYNLVSLDGTNINPAGIQNSATLYVASTTVNGFNIRNNVFLNTMYGPTGTIAYNVYLASSACLTGSTLNYNCYWKGSEGSFYGYNGGVINTFEGWQTSTTQEANSMLADPLYGSNTYFAPQIGSPLLGAGIPIATVTTDFDQSPRGTVATTIGPYEGFAQSLTSPANNANCVPVPPTGNSEFDWPDVEGATYYQIQISTMPDFTSLVVDQNNLPTSDYSTSALSPLTVYYWRAKAANANGALTAWSAPWMFTTEGPVGAPTLLTPIDGSVATFPVTATWLNAYTAEGCQFQVATDVDFTNIIFDVTPTGTSYAFPVDGWTQGTLYYLRGRSWKPCAVSDWSSPVSFTTDVLNAPVITSPNDGATSILFPVNTTWTARTSAAYYQLQVSETSDFSSIIYDVNVNAPATSYTYSLDNWNVFTTYYTRARVCNPPLYSDWSPVNAFTTGNMLAIGESFEGETFPPVGWTSYMGGGNTSVNWARVANGTYPACNPHTGSWLAQLNCYSFSSGYADLVTGNYDLTWRTSGQAFPFSFWLDRQLAYSGYYDRIELYVNTTPDLNGTPTFLGTYHAYANYEPVETVLGWHQYTVNIPTTYNGPNNYIIFHGITAFYNNLHVDDVYPASYQMLIPQTVESIVASQPWEETLPRGTNMEQKVLKVEVNAPGNFRFLTVQEMAFNALGTTSADDIQNARLYYTGAQNSFSPVTKFNATYLGTVEEPFGEGGFSFETDVELVGGTNYFWLTFEVPSTAGLNNTIDVSCTNVVIGNENYTPFPQTGEEVFTVHNMRPFDLYNGFMPINNPTNNFGQYGAIFDNTNYVVSSWSNTPPYLNYYSFPANTLVSENTFAALTTNPRDLDWDGDNIYAAMYSTTSNLYQFTTQPTLTLLNTTPITFTGTAISPRGLAYDPTADGGNGGFWVSDWASDIVLVSMTGNELLRIPSANTSAAAPSRGGLAIDYWTPGGPFLWAFCQIGTAGSDRTVLVQLGDLYNEDPNLRGIPTGVTYNIAPVIGTTGLDYIAGGLYIREDSNNNILLGTMTQGSPGILSEYFLIRNVPMTYVGATVTDATENYVVTGSADNPIISIEVTTDGITMPLDVTSFTFNTDGTTSTLDISNARVYYTGNDPDFATTNLFGTFEAPDGEFVIEGVQTLLSGTNYFWLTFDIAGDAVDFNHVDAECTEFTTVQSGVTETRIPTVTDPEGYARIISPLSGPYNVGVGSSHFLNFSEAFEVATLAGLQGDVDFRVISDIVEPQAAFLGQWPEYGEGMPYYINIYPTGGNRVISCVNDMATFWFDGTDRVRINGSIDGVGTNRNLTISNNITTGTWSLAVAFVRESNDGSNDIQVRNTILRSSGPALTNSYPLFVGGGVSDAGEDHHYMLFQNNAFEKGRIGAYVWHPSTTANTAYDIQFINNDFGSVVTDNYLTVGGIYANTITDDGSGTQPLIIKKNRFFNIINTNVSTTVSGIFAYSCTYANIIQNTFNNIKNNYAASLSTTGIELNSCNYSLVANNLIYDIGGNGGASPSSSIVGLRSTSCQNAGIYFNTVYLYGDLTGTATTEYQSAAFQGQGNTGMMLQNNSFTNYLTHTAGTNKAYSAHMSTFAEFAAVDNNPDFNNYRAAYVGYGNGADRQTLANWQAATGKDVNSLSVDPNHTSLTNYYLLNTSFLIFGGINVNGITTDIVDAERYSTPTIGAYEYTTGDVLQKPTPILPEYNTCGVTLPAYFEWTPIAGAISYTLEYSYNADFSGSVVIPNIATTTYNLELNPASTVYWHVKAVSDFTESNYCRDMKFVTAGDLTAPILISPLPNAIDQPLSVTLSWTPVPGACGGYYIELADNPNLIGGWYVESQTNSVTISGLTPATTYYWHVRGQQEGNNGPWSDVQRFSTLPEMIVYVGTGSNYNSYTTYPAPYGKWYNSARHQMLILASELTALGMSAGPISSLGFNVQAVNTSGNHPGFYIKMKHTTLTSLSGWVTATDWVNCWGPTDYTPSVGWNIHEFANVFTWNGTDNIIVETCFSNYPNGFTQNASMYYTTTPFTSVVYYNTDGANTCLTSPTSAYTSTNRPNMRLQVTGGSASGGLPVPYLLSPANNSTGVSVTPNFTWTLLPPDNPSVYNYELQILDPSDPLNIFTTIVYNTTSFQVNEPLLYNHTYQWRVRVLSGEDQGGWSGTLSFSTLSYCGGSVGFCSELAGTEYISNVNFAGIDNPSACPAESGYSDFTTVNANVTRGGTYLMTVNVENPSTTDDVYAWIDWNQDGVLGDEGELYNLTTVDDGYTFTTSINIATDEMLGRTRLRIRLSDATPIPPCGVTELGDIEDYSITISPVLPIITVNTITPSAYCAGASITVPFTVTYTTSNPGNFYQAWLDIPDGDDIILGSVLANEMGDYSITGTLPITLPSGNYSVYIKGTNPLVYSDLSAVFTVNAIPLEYFVTGGGSYCYGGNGVPVGLSMSESGVSYQLYYNNIAFGSPLEGTGEALDFGNQTAAGTYTVVGTSLAGCVNNMGGNAVVSINELPITYAIVGGGNYCLDAVPAGVMIGLAGSQIGVTYRLYFDGAVIATKAGTGNQIYFGNPPAYYTEPGIYTITATTTAGCSITLGTTSVDVVEPSTVYAMLGGGQVCEGTAGLPLSLAGSDEGVTYRLYRNGIVVATFTGTGSALDFGNWGAGNYYSSAWNGSCETWMNDAQIVTINEIFSPIVYDFYSNADGHYCAGSEGVDLNLSDTQLGVLYNVYLNGELVTSYTGTGNPMSEIGAYPEGEYTVEAVYQATGCSSVMNGAVTVVIDPLLPVVEATPTGVDVPFNPVVFDWTLAQCADSYRLIISTNEDLTEPFFDLTITADQLPLNVNGLAGGVTYYYQITAYSGEIPAVSGRFDFTTETGIQAWNLDLPQGWSLVSTYRIPTNPAMVDVWAPVVDNMVITKNAMGEFWIPSSGAGTLTTWDNLSGYHVYMNEAATLPIYGTQDVPLSTVFPMPTAGWYLVSYLPHEALQAPVALSSIVSKLILAKNGMGEIYCPPFNVNTLENNAGTMLPGRGYYIYVASAANLVYPDMDARISSTEAGYTVLPEVSHIKAQTKHTGSSATLILETSLTDGTEIGVYDGRGVVVGSGAVSNGRAFITIWGDNGMTQSADGALEGEYLHLKSYDVSTNRMSDIKLSELTEITRGISSTSLQYQTNGIFMGRGAAVEAHGELSITNMPNPFTSETTIKFNLPESGDLSIELYTLQGVKVAQIANGSYDAGEWSIGFNSGMMAAGVYNMVLRIGSQTAQTQMIIVK
jgi:hypothetical protein